MKTVLITGGNGFMGRNLANLFTDNNYNVFSPSKDVLDLLKPIQVKSYIEHVEPDIIIHAAIKGGTVVDKDTLQDTADNIQMYENLLSFVPEYTPIIIIGSGAEYDRRQDIDCVKENEIEERFPIDPYGLSKNIIARKAYQDTNSHIFRLFGCFNYDEEPFRFIKQCMINIKNETPIKIHQNRMMDFFYMDDVFTILDHYLINDINEYGFKIHMNLVYEDKYSLIDIACMICNVAKTPNHPIIIENEGNGLSYTGDGSFLSTICKKNNIKLIGLEEGIVETWKKLHSA